MPIDHVTQPELRQTGALERLTQVTSGENSNVYLSSFRLFGRTQRLDIQRLVLDLSREHLDTSTATCLHGHSDVSTTGTHAHCDQSTHSICISNAPLNNMELPNGDREHPRNGNSSNTP